MIKTLNGWRNAMGKKRSFKEAAVELESLAINYLKGRNSPK